MRIARRDCRAQAKFFAARCTPQAPECSQAHYSESSPVRLMPGVFDYGVQLIDAIPCVGVTLQNNVIACPLKT